MSSNEELEARIAILEKTNAQLVKAVGEICKAVQNIEQNTENVRADIHTIEKRGRPTSATRTPDMRISREQ